MSINGTLENMANSSWVPTPLVIGQRLLNLLQFPTQQGDARPVMDAPPPGSTITVFDPTCGNGDLLLPFSTLPGTKLYGVEISSEHTLIARERLPEGATLVNSAYEGMVIAEGTTSLLVQNPPYFFVDGTRAEYRFLIETGKVLMPGGILIAIIPARVAWDAKYIKHMLKWYDSITVWKLPDSMQENEDDWEPWSFQKYTQIVVVGVRRAEQQLVNEDEFKRLAAFHYQSKKKDKDGNLIYTGENRWVNQYNKEGIPPPEVPTSPIEHPYAVQAAPAKKPFTMTIKKAGEAALLDALVTFSKQPPNKEWVDATSWRDRGGHANDDDEQGKPAMPLLGPGHVAAVVATGALDGRRILVPPVSASDEEGVTAATTAAPVAHILSSFVSRQWTKQPIDADKMDELRTRGIVRAQMRQREDKPVLGVTNLQSGESTYYQGEQVFEVLKPWLHTMAEQVAARREPLYKLNPPDWQLRVMTEFAQGKQLKGADCPGLAPAQIHRVCAMYASLCANHKTAEQGEPGTGKTMMAGGVALLMAYAWRNRLSPEFRETTVPQKGWKNTEKKETWHTPQPDWVEGLRRAWLKNPRTLAMMGMEPIRDDIHHRVIYYRHIKTGYWLEPDQVGPRAFPCLVTTPKKVTLEYGKEIQAAFPRAEVMLILKYTDIDKWMRRCIESDAPIVMGILSHSTKKAFGRAWQPAVLTKKHKVREAVLDPTPQQIEDLQLKAIKGADGKLYGYESAITGKILTTTREVDFFYCPDCKGRIDAVPDSKKGAEKKSEKDKKEMEEPVTDLIYFKKKQRWCKCEHDSRNRPGSSGNRNGRYRSKGTHISPLWTDARTAVAQQKYPQRPYSEWVHAMETDPAARTRQHPRPEDSFSLYDYLYRFFKGCVGLTVVDESHNGRGRSTDIAQAHHYAMMSAQTYALTSGTHYGGDVLSFYHYWFRFNPRFWRRLGLSWNEPEEALRLYGVVQEWMTESERESDARAGSGQTDIKVSTIPAPGIGAELIPDLLNDIVYIGINDVGSFMPDKNEFPDPVSMKDETIEQPRQEAKAQREEAQRLHAEYLKEHNGEKNQAMLDAIESALFHENEVNAWADERDLYKYYVKFTRRLDDLSKDRVQAAIMAKGTIPRLYAALPCESVYQVYQGHYSTWGEKTGTNLLAETKLLSADHVYPLERRLLEHVEKEVGEGRRVMVYFYQNGVRTMARRLSHILEKYKPWTLPNNVDSEDRQEAILKAVKQDGHQVIIVPYTRVNEGLNLQSAVDTIIWYEMAMNLFMLDQASRRAWRLGKLEEVRIVYLVYAGTAGHKKLHKLGQQSGAASAFAGEPARGALIKHAGADQTTLARLSDIIDGSEEEQQQEEGGEASGLFPDLEAQLSRNDGDALKELFKQKGDELKHTLQKGREWLGGIIDTLPERLREMMRTRPPMSIWEVRRPLTMKNAVIARPVQEQPVTAIVEPPRPRFIVTKRAFIPGLPLAEQPKATSIEYDDGTTIVPIEEAREEKKGVTPPLLQVGERAIVAFGDLTHIGIAKGRVAKDPKKKKRVPRTVVTTIAAVAPLLLTETSTGTPVVEVATAQHDLWSMEEEESAVSPSLLTPPPTPVSSSSSSSREVITIDTGNTGISEVVTTLRVSRKALLTALGQITLVTQTQRKKGKVAFDHVLVLKHNRLFLDILATPEGSMHIEPLPIALLSLEGKGEGTYRTNQGELLIEQLGRFTTAKASDTLVLQIGNITPQGRAILTMRPLIPCGFTTSLYLTVVEPSLPSSSEEEEEFFEEAGWDDTRDLVESIIV